MARVEKILNNFQEKVLKEFAQSDLSKYFYWSGGTALAYGYLSHRLSEDLDFMSEELLPDEYLLSLVKDLANRLGLDKIEQKKIYNRNKFIFYKNRRSLKLEFIYYPFKNLRKPRSLQEFGMKISSLEDIAVNKVHALYERGEPKDAFDLYWILRENKNLTLKSLARLVTNKFGVEIDYIKLNAQALRAIDKMKNIQPLMTNRISYKEDEIKEYFQKQANKYLRKHLNSCNL